MILLTEKRNRNSENNDILIDVEHDQPLPFKQQLLEKIESKVDELKTDETINKVLELFKAEKLEPLQEENEVLQAKIESFERENEALLQKIDQFEKNEDTLTEKIAQLEQENNELQEKVLELEEASKPSKEYDAEILESLIFPINTIDQIAAAYRNTGENDLIAEQLEKVAELTIQHIASVGIEEIPVYGKEIDGSYMESFGPASHVKDESLPPHSVAIVSRRAFKRKDSDEIIQHALVYTVPEEE